MWENNGRAVGWPGDLEPDLPVPAKARRAWRMRQGGSSGSPDISLDAYNTVYGIHPGTVEGPYRAAERSIR
nr:hypothetical protein Ade03nite_42810 [Actinoplanes derwentensis]